MTHGQVPDRLLSRAGADWEHPAAAGTAFSGGDANGLLGAPSPWEGVSLPQVPPTKSLSGVGGQRPPVPPSLDTQGTSCTKPAKSTPEKAAEWAAAFRVQVADLLDGTWSQRAHALRQCGVAAVQLDCKGCQTPHIVPFRCGARTCPTCARIGAAGLAARIGARVAEHDRVMVGIPWDGVGAQQLRTWRFITLTSRAVEDVEDRFHPQRLRTRVRTVRAAFGKFWRSTSWGQQVRGVGAGKRSRRDTSYIYAQEISPQGMVHAHILVYGEYVNQRHLQSLWSRAMGETARVHVRTVSVEQGIAGAIRETLKYATKGEKGSRVQAARAAAVEIALRHVHRVGLGGAIRRIRTPESTTASEDVSAEDLHATQELHCHACGVIGWWKWAGIVDASVVAANGGFGMMKPIAADSS